MKKQIVLATSAALLCGSVWASKARMQALGQNPNIGSPYLADSRNVFRNPASILMMNNYAVVEWGDDAAEGGFFRADGPLTYGVYLGSDLNSQNTIRNGGTGYAGTTGYGHAGFAPRANELDLFVAGDMGVEWGVRFGYAAGAQKDGFEASNSAMNLSAGAIFGDISVYANMNLSDESDKALAVDDDAAAATAVWEGDNFRIGGRYTMDDMHIFANMHQRGGTYTPASGTAKSETSENTLTAGVAKVRKMGASSMMICDISYISRTAEDKPGGAAKTERTSTTIPLTLAFESDVASWLTIRGSISQSIFLNEMETKGPDGTTTQNATSTNVETGATLNFGKLKIDGIIGNDPDPEVGENGVLSTDNLMTRVAVNYMF